MHDLLERVANTITKKNIPYFTYSFPNCWTDMVSLAFKYGTFFFPMMEFATRSRSSCLIFDIGHVGNRALDKKARVGSSAVI